MDQNNYRELKYKDFQNSGSNRTYENSVKKNGDSTEHMSLEKKLSNLSMHNNDALSGKDSNLIIPGSDLAAEQIAEEIGEETPDYIRHESYHSLFGFDDLADIEEFKPKLDSRKIRRKRHLRRIRENCCNQIVICRFNCYRIFFIFLFFYSLYLLVIIPFRVGFLTEDIIPWIVVEQCVEFVILTIDLMLSCSTKYNRNYEIHTWPCDPLGCFDIFCPKEGCFPCLGQCSFSHYISKHVIMDFLIYFPFYFLTFAINPIIQNSYPSTDFVMVCSWLKLPKLLIFFRISLFFSRLQIFRITRIKRKVIQFFFVVFLIAHYIGCCFHLVVRFGNDPAAVEFAMNNQILQDDSIFFKYIFSMYWSLVTMTGYGGTLPVTDFQVVFSIVVVFIGVVVYVTVIGIMGSMITNLDINATAYQDRVDTMNDYMKFRKLDNKTTKRIRRYYHYLWSTRDGMDEAKIMFSFPEYLRLKVSRFLNKDMLRKFHFFTESSDGFIRGIFVRLIPKTVFPGSYIIKQGEIGKEMYFLTKGCVDIMVKGLPNPVVSLSAVCYFGEAALLTGNKRNASIVAKEFCDMFVLKQRDFEDICSIYEEEKARIWRIHKDRTKETEAKAKAKEKEEAEAERLKQQKERENRVRIERERRKRRVDRLRTERQVVFESRQRKQKLRQRKKKGRVQKSRYEIIGLTKEVM